MHGSTLYRITVSALMTGAAIGLHLSIKEPLILLITVSPFLLALLLSLSDGFVKNPGRVTAFTLPALGFFFFAFYPWFVRRDEVVRSSSTSVLDFINYPITACVLGLACLALFEIVAAIVGNKVNDK